MRLSHVYLLFLLILGCQPKETSEVATIPAAPDSLEKTVDSANNTQQDGTLTTAVAPQDVKQQLPPELEVLLDRTHGLWRLTPVQDQDAARVTQDQQGPYFLQTDVNKDNLVDYVVQVTEKEVVRVYVFVRPKIETQNWQEAVLETKPVLTIEGVQRSPLYLTLLEERKDSTASRATSIREGVVVNIGNRATLHQWRAGKWEKTELSLEK